MHADQGKVIDRVRDILKRCDWLVLGIPVILTIIGILTIYSATRSVIEPRQPSFYLRQTIWLILGMVTMFSVSLFDYRVLKRFSILIYSVSIGLLLLTLVVGHPGMGAQRWLKMGNLSFQPTEIFRVAMIVSLASYLSGRPSPLGTGRTLTALCFFGFIPATILYLQPDLGSALMILGLVVSMLLIKGLTKRVLVAALAVVLIAIPVGGERVWNGLKEYQRNRLVAFINPEVDPTGIGYQIKQSKITIGSGRVFGKGYLQGTQGPLRFLPERHTDFIFSVFAEEWGFVGSLFLLILYGALLLRGLEIALHSKDEFGYLIATGISVMFLAYSGINLGMTMGLMPVVGIPLPFFSYGGTALLANFICIGLLNNIKMRRFELFY